MNNPQIFLAVDNCFASKRWTKPREWMQMIKEAGAYYVEASADNECDPLYSTPEYINQWMNEIKEYSQTSGVRIANLYSGHGTYATLGLAHDSKSVRDKILNQWIKKMLAIAVELDAGLGFYCHAFSDSVLQNPTLYYNKENELISALAELTSCVYGYKKGLLGVEQMYTPHQTPWTILGAKELMKRVFQICGNPLYITIDTGHQSGQYKFQLPDHEKLKRLLDVYRKGNRVENLWLGPKTAYTLFYQCAESNAINTEDCIRNIEMEMAKYSYLFSRQDDADTYSWLKKLGCYSPIIHLQQTDGMSSSHKPFTYENNKTGIIQGEKVLRAIQKAYDQESDHNMPPKVPKIYFTLEIFSGTADINVDIVYKLHESVSYWRKFIPEDGLRLHELIGRLEK